MDEIWVEFDGVDYAIDVEWDDFEEGWVVTRCVNLDIDPDEGDPVVEDEILLEILLDKAVDVLEYRDRAYG